MAKAYNCHITRVSPMIGTSGEAVVLIALTDLGGAFADRWFQADELVRREVLALALTAVSSGLRVSVELDSEEQWSTAKFVCLLRPGVN